MGRRAGGGQIDPRLLDPWGEPPWHVTFVPPPAAVPTQVDVAVIGGGFTGLAAACWLRHLSPHTSVAVFEAGRLGAGASGRTGGVVLDETAAGSLPGLGNVISDFGQALELFRIDCSFEPTGAWEISHRRQRADSPLKWNDGGPLRVAGDVPGGIVDPARLLDGLAHAAQASGALLFEHTPVRELQFGEPLRVALDTAEVHADSVLVAVNGAGRRFSPYPQAAQAAFTLALATAPLSDAQLAALSAEPLKPFYTVDLPYLWGRPLEGNRVLLGGGLVLLETPAALDGINIAEGDAADLLGKLEQRVRGLVPALASVTVTHRWGGPILFAPGGRPLLCAHPQSPDILLLGGYSGQGVAQSVCLARWAVEALLGWRDLPAWRQPDPQRISMQSP